MAVKIAIFDHFFQLNFSISLGLQKKPGPESVPVFSESISATMEAHLFVAHHRDIVQAIKVGKRLEIGLVFNQLLSASANERLRYLTQK
jgi:hypothetical protein